MITGIMSQSFHDDIEGLHLVVVRSRFSLVLVLV
jgi:hypothetical protein